MRDLDFKISSLSARFLDTRVEQAYQKFVFSDNFRINMIVISAGVLLHSLYAVLDISKLGDAAIPAVSSRLGGSFFSAILLIAACTRKFRKHYENLLFAIGTILGLSLMLVVHFTPKLEHAYYVAFIQISVFMCCLIRLSFLKSASILALYLLGFTAVSFSKGQPEEATVQVFILVSMFIILAVTAYFLQRMRRVDFAKTQKINKQNEQLSLLLEETQSQNRKKIAAMNVLVHFVRTPVHQIAGFTDIVINELRDVKDVPAMCGEGVQYIKSASQDLSSNVSKLLSYHRLDEFPTHQEPSVVGLSESVSETFLYIDEGIKVAPEIDDIRMTTHEGPLKIALSSLAEYYKDQRPSLSTLKIDMLDQGAVVQLEITDDCPLLDKETFEHNSKPLTELEDYLRVSGAEMSMLLRTVRKAIEICGGSFTHETRDDQNVMVITLPKDLSKTEALVA